VTTLPSHRAQWPITASGNGGFIAGLALGPRLNVEVCGKRVLRVLRRTANGDLASRSNLADGRADRTLVLSAWSPIRTAARATANNCAQLFPYWNSAI
jgi:hypothetical protein